jgi:hypothetical protein
MKPKPKCTHCESSERVYVLAAADGSKAHVCEACLKALYEMVPN